MVGAPLVQPLTQQEHELPGRIGLTVLQRPAKFHYDMIGIPELLFHGENVVDPVDALLEERLVVDHVGAYVVLAAQRLVHVVEHIGARRN